MKRLIVIALVSLTAAGGLFAQAAQTAPATPNAQTAPAAPAAQPYWGRGRMMGNQAAPVGAPVTVEGKLVLLNGIIAVQAKDKTYYAGELQRLVGFIDGLKEGATVKLEGQAFADPQDATVQHLFIAKLTFNGKTYDLAQTGGPGMGYGPQGMMGGRDDRGGGRRR
jgi:hypothetical protein